MGTPTGTAYSDTGLAPATTYRFRVRAVDAAGNLSTYSSIVTATTPDAPLTPPGLVGAWGFNEGTGPTTADSSGNGNLGTLVGGASWSTQGRYGGALSFNGSNSLVQVADSASLDLTTAMTLSAWIMPTATSERLAHHSPAPARLILPQRQPRRRALRPAGGGTFGTSITFVSGPTACPSRLDRRCPRLRRHHPAAFRERHPGRHPCHRLAPSSATNNPLWIGGNKPYGEFFTGLIDEVRVYNRALTQTDIQTDMNSPVPGP